jgi:phosphoribosylglycinamide formyltransferase-1
MANIAIFASGTGSNARKIIEHFYTKDNHQVKLIISNKRTAAVLNIADEYEDVCKFVLERDYFYQSEDLLNILQEERIDNIVLAGFLWLIPPYLIARYENKIINIHPALLPKYGGKGMYGHHVHQAVKEAGEIESGPTIHLVNTEYDKGEILFQARCKISPKDTTEEIAKKVLNLEHQNYPLVIEKWLEK